MLADFGDFALQSEDVGEVLTEACRLVADAMSLKRAKVLQIEHSEESLFVRAGVGWGPDVVGKLRLPMDERSSETYAIRAGEPIISRDISKERRFEVPEFMKKEGVVALANVPIFLPGRRAFGLLQVDDTDPREFDEDDTEFLRTYSAILGPVIDRLLRVDDLRRSEQRFRHTVGAAADYAIFVTDAEQPHHGLAVRRSRSVWLSRSAAGDQISRGIQADPRPAPPRGPQARHPLRLR